MTYWTFYLNPETGYSQVLEATWRGDRVDFLRKAQGRMYKNVKDAKAALVEARAMREVMPLLELAVENGVI